MMVRPRAETALLDDAEFGRPRPMSAVPESIVQSRSDSEPIWCGDSECRLLEPMLAVRWPGFAGTFARFAVAADPGNPVSLVEPDRPGRLVGGLREGAALLGDVLPWLGPEVWSHADAVTLIDSAGRYLSLTIPVGPAGLLAIDRCVLQTPARTAELLFHEAVHAKLRRIEADGPLLHHDRDDGVLIDWREENWPVSRALAALHVYVHLVALGDAMAVMALSPDTADFGRRLRASAAARACYLLGAMTVVGALNDRGRRFVAWLGHTMAEWRAVAPSL